jgi:hypothetical protein
LVVCTNSNTNTCERDCATDAGPAPDSGPAADAGGQCLPVDATCNANGDCCAGLYCAFNGLVGPGQCTVLPVSDGGSGPDGAMCIPTGGVCGDFSFACCDPAALCDAINGGLGHCRIGLQHDGGPTCQPVGGACQNQNDCCSGESCEGIPGGGAFCVATPPSDGGPIDAGPACVVTGAMCTDFTQCCDPADICTGSNGAPGFCQRTIPPADGGPVGPG